MMPSTFVGSRLVAACRVYPFLLVALLSLAPGGLLAQESEDRDVAGEPAAAGADTLESLPAQPAFASLVGQVVSASDGRPIERAYVSMVGTGIGAITDSAGHFGIPRTSAGVDTVSVHYIGYETSKVEIDLVPDGTTRVVLLLSPTVVRVADIHVEVARSRPGPMRDFDRRRSGRGGTYLTREDIERRKPTLASDAFRGIPGVDVGPVFMGKAVVRMSRHVGDCPPNMFVDGIYMPRFEIDDLRVEDLEAVEIYRSPAQIPPEFKTIGSSGCGAIVIWTTGGGTRG